MSIDAVHIHICIQLVIVNRGWREREWIHMAAVYARGHTQSKAGFRIFCCDQMCMMYVSIVLLLLSSFLLLLSYFLYLLYLI